MAVAEAFGTSNSTTHLCSDLLLSSDGLFWFCAAPLCMGYCCSCISHNFVFTRSLVLQIVQNALETKNVVATCFGNEMMKTMLPHLLEQLELCQKSLSAYLETKRAEFPRFYFVSDPTLLEILSLGSDPPSVVPHFQSGLFDSLTNVSFDKVDKTKMTEMFSQQGEKVEFERPVEAKGMLYTYYSALHGCLA